MLRRMNSLNKLQISYGEPAMVKQLRRINITGDWHIDFPAGRGAPDHIVIPELISWSDSDHEGVKYFSGIATYNKKFYIPPEYIDDELIISLDLGKVREVIEIYLNGKNMGILWKQPYQMDITRAAQAGENTITLEVANTWSNRLTGDGLLPEGERYTKTNITGPDFLKKTLWKDVPLLESGYLFLYGDMNEAGAIATVCTVSLTAKVNITPAVPIPLSGSRSRTKPFEGIHDSIYARAIVFSDGGNKAAIISAEIIGFSNSFCEETSGLIEQKVGIKQENILLTVIHNHSGPVTRVYKDDVSPEVNAYADELKKKLIRLVIEADGNIQLGRNPCGPCDHEVGVVHIDDVEGNIMSLLLNWLCHAVGYGSQKLLYQR